MSDDPGTSLYHIACLRQKGSSQSRMQSSSRRANARGRLTRRVPGCCCVTIYLGIVVIAQSLSRLTILAANIFASTHFSCSYLGRVTLDGIRRYIREGRHNIFVDGCWVGFHEFAHSFKSRRLATLQECERLLYYV